MKSKVYLVGAGPGDPGLVTVKGQACIARADVVIYDYLAAPALLDHARPDAECIYVGKKGGDHTLSQEKINALLVDKARQGAVVARLKGGDPFIFGRGAEEAQALIEAKIPFEIVPGITSAIAAPAYAGIPLTHRKLASTVAFVTGHEDPQKDQSTINWAALARGVSTLVFLMGVKNLPRITRQLVAHGRSPDTPTALVRWGTTPRQVTVTGTLKNIVKRAAEAGLTAPAVVVVGDVVGLRATLQWFEKRPLAGKTIVVTRARAQASGLVKRLADAGAQCLECPTIRIVPPADDAPLKTAVKNLPIYDWIVFTSVNATAFFFRYLFAAGLDVRALGHLRIGAIGPATAASLSDYGLKSDLVPATYQAEAVVEAFSRTDIKGCKILLPRAAEARPVLPAELSKMGARVDAVSAYRTVQDRDGAQLLTRRLAEKSVDLITFTSSSTVKNFKSLLPPQDFKQLIAEVAVACIGPITAATARQLGFEVPIMAESYTIPGLCEAIENYYRTNNEK